MKHISEWKGVREFVSRFFPNIHVRTLKRWHYEIAPLSFQKTYPSPQGRVETTDDAVREWLEKIGKFPDCHY